MAQIFFFYRIHTKCEQQTHWVHLGTILAFLPLLWRMEQCHGQQVCSQAVVYYLLAPKHFEVYHQKFEETEEEALQTSCTWNTHGNEERETHESSTFNSSPFLQNGGKNKWIYVKATTTQTYFAMRESFTTIARLKITFRSTGSRMWSGDCFCLRAIFQLPSVTHRFFYSKHTHTHKKKHLLSFDRTASDVSVLFLGRESTTNRSACDVIAAHSGVQTWFAIKELQAAQLHFEAVICSGHDVFNVACAHWQLRQMFPAETGHLKIQQIGVVQVKYSDT